MDSKIVTLMNSIFNVLREVYSAYFIYESNTTKEDKIQQGSFENFIEFTKDFEILPYLLNMNQTVCYWNYINNNNGTYKNFQIYDDKRELGKIFTFSKFTCMIVHFGIMTFGKINQSLNAHFSEIEKILFFLEKLENSNGFKNLERKTNKPHNSVVTFIPNKNVIKNLIPNSTITLSIFNDYESNGLTNLRQSKELNPKSPKNPESELFKLLKVSPEIIDKLESNLELLKDLYITYSKYGDKLNYNKMNFAGFQNLLKDLDLIQNSRKDLSSDLLSSRTIKSPKSAVSIRSNLTSPKKVQNCSVTKGKMIDSEVTCIFCSLTGYKNFDTSVKYKNQFNKNKGFSTSLGESGRVTNIEKSSSLSSLKTNLPMRMDFNIFVKSLELISTRLYPNKSLDDAMSNFLEFDLNKINDKQKIIVNGKKEILEILQSLRKDEIVEIIKDINTVVRIHYDNYADSNNLIGFDKFFQFYKDFSIFPDVVNLIQTKNIFFALADIFYSNIYDIQNNFIKTKSNSIELNDKNKENDCKIRNLLNKNELINFDLFLDSLAIASIFIKFSKKYDEVEKILYLIEKMNHSKGLSKSQYKNGQTFRSVNDFSNYFNFLRNKYPSFYEKKQSNYKTNKDQVKFIDIFDK